jgi:hypothetical protein
MENQQKKENGFLKPVPTSDESPNTNSNIESHKQKEEDGYKAAIEDTMIGYDGKPESIDADLGNNTGSSQNKHGVDDND